MKTNIFFKETQSGLKNWVMVAVILFTMIPVSIFLSFKMIQTSNSEKFIFLGLIIFIAILCLFLVFIKLKIEVTENEVRYRLFPFHFSTQILSKNEIVEVENVIYNPIKEWGGWGIRYDFKGNKAYNMYGNKGVQVTLKNGKIILFGSQKPNELYDAILRK